MRLADVVTLAVIALLGLAAFAVLGVLHGVASRPTVGCERDAIGLDSLPVPPPRTTPGNLTPPDFDG